MRNAHTLRCERTSPRVYTYDVPSPMRLTQKLAVRRSCWSVSANCHRTLIDVMLSTDPDEYHGNCLTFLEYECWRNHFFVVSDAAICRCRQPALGQFCSSLECMHYKLYWHTHAQLLTCAQQDAIATRKATATSSLTPIQPNLTHTCRNITCTQTHNAVLTHPPASSSSPKNCQPNRTAPKQP